MENGWTVDYPIGIPEFYKGKTLFVTGFTGYLGKLLVEKLLYSCPDLERIYVLIRSKKGVDPLERCRQTFNSMAFERLLKKYPNALSKVRPICGDMLSDNLGMSDEDRRTLADEVNMVFHGAASVRFDDPLALAINQNIRGTKMIIDLALTMTKLDCLVYISTAYSNCDYYHIKERLYPSRQDWRVTLDIADKIDPATLEILSQKCLDKLPNTYTYSKSIAEHLANDYRHKLPIVIVRPSVVISGLEEPIKGWIDSYNGPMALMMANVMGITRCSYAVDDNFLNYIYSDHVINATIVIGWKSVLRREELSKDEILIYNVCAPPDCRLSLSGILAQVKGAPPNLIDATETGISSLSLYTSLFWFKVAVFYRHVISSVFIDSILRLMNKPPMLLKLRRKLMISGEIALHHFTSNSFNFDTERFNGLLQDLRGEDRQVFGWSNSREIFARNVVNTFMLCRKTLLSPIYNDRAKNFKYLTMLYYVDRSAVMLTYSSLAWLLYSFQIPQSMLSALVSFSTLPQ